MQCFGGRFWIRDFICVLCQLARCWWATDGCSSQYKSRHCLGDLSFATTEYGYKVFHRNFFKTSHAKGPQDAAEIWLYFILFNTVVVFWVIMYTNAMFWRQILNKRFHLCTLPVSTMWGNTIIQNAKDLFSFCNNFLKEPRSALFKRRILRYVESVDRDRYCLNRYILKSHVCVLVLHVSYTLYAENNLIVFHSFQHSGSFLSNHVYKCNVLEADSE
jgi:hypothetical protein